MTLSFSTHITPSVYTKAIQHHCSLDIFVIAQCISS